MNKKPKKGVFTWLDLKMHKKLTNDLVEHAKILSEKFYKYESVCDLDCSRFFDPKTVEDYNYIFISDWAFDCAVPYIQFTAIDDRDEVCDVAEIAISFFKMTLPQIEKLEKECEKIKKKTDKKKTDKKDAEDEEYKTYLKLKEKFKDREFPDL